MAETKAKPSIVAAVPSEKRVSDYNLGSRQTDELVIGLVGPVGSGVTMTANSLITEFRERYGYESTYLRVSGVIKDCADLVAAKISEGDEATESRACRKLGPA